MNRFDFAFDAKEANRRTKSTIDHDNESILRKIFNNITEAINLGKFETYYEFYNIKNEYIKDIVESYGYRTEWEETMDFGETVWFLNIFWV